MYVAMKDLEIRGAGNILGTEQSGSIAGVGFDLYVRMVGEAVRELKGDQSAAQEVETKVELPINAHIPHDYVPGERLRLEAYRRIAEVASEDDIAAIREELLDRYGEPPQPVDNLLAVARFRVLARSAGLTDVVLQGTQIRFPGGAARIPAVAAASALPQGGGEGRDADSDGPGAQVGWARRQAVA